MHEIGPEMLMYTGKVIFFGAANSNGHGKTALYTPPGSPSGTGTWMAGPDIPTVGNQTIVCNDVLVLLPNGKVFLLQQNTNVMIRALQSCFSNTIQTQTLSRKHQHH